MAYKFEIYTTDKCKWCVEAKNLVTRLGHSYTELPVAAPGHRKFFDEQGFKTVPQIYVEDGYGGRDYIGGYTDLWKWFEDRGEYTK